MQALAGLVYIDIYQLESHELRMHEWATLVRGDLSLAIVFQLFLLITQKQCVQENASSLCLPPLQLHLRCIFCFHLRVDKC